MAFHVYMLRCADDSCYTGHTDNIEMRLASHQAGEIAGYTATRLPVALVFCEALASRLEALEMERRIKGWSRAKKEALMRGDWNEIARLARNASKRADDQAVCGSTGSPRTVTSAAAAGAAEQTIAVCAELVEGQKTTAVRPELVEGQNTTAVRPELVEGQKSREDQS